MVKFLCPFDVLSVNLFVQAIVAYVENSKHARVSKIKL